METKRIPGVEEQFGGAPFYRSLVEASPYAVVATTLEGAITYASEQAARQWGGDCHEELIGKRAFELLPPEERERAARNLERTLAEERVERVQYRMLRADGTTYLGELSAVLVRDPEGRPAGFVATIGDLTEQKKVEAALRDSEARYRELNRELERRVAERTAQLEAANRELESFAYSVSHDLRSPLTAIDGYCHALREDLGDTVDSTCRDYLDRVSASSARMEQLIGDLLRLAHLTSGDLERNPVDISELARNAGERLLAATPDRGAEIVVQPGLKAQTDLRLTQIVLDNLLGNAWKFTAEERDARIEVGALVGEEPRAPEQVVYFVGDNGVGFEVARATSLFKPFQRFHSPDRFPGTGIGLATVQRIVARHGGQIWLESAVGEGTTVYFTMGR